jgi:hypothetical protein
MNSAWRLSEQSPAGMHPLLGRTWIHFRHRSCKPRYHAIPGGLCNCVCPGGLCNCVCAVFRKIASKRRKGLNFGWCCAHPVTIVRPWVPLVQADANPPAVGLMATEDHAHGLSREKTSHLPDIRHRLPRSCGSRSSLGLGFGVPSALTQGNDRVDTYRLLAQLGDVDERVRL